MTAKQRKARKLIYRQGIENLRLEGMQLKISQHKMAMLYQSGKISHTELLDRALAYARSR